MLGQPHPHQAGRACPLPVWHFVFFYSESSVLYLSSVTYHVLNVTVPSSYFYLIWCGSINESSIAADSTYEINNVKRDFLSETGGEHFTAALVGQICSGTTKASAGTCAEQRPLCRVPTLQNKTNKNKQRTTTYFQLCRQ